MLTLQIVQSKICMTHEFLFSSKRNSNMTDNIQKDETGMKGEWVDKNWGSLHVLTLKAYLGACMQQSSHCWVCNALSLSTNTLGPKHHPFISFPINPKSTISPCFLVFCWMLIDLLGIYFPQKKCGSPSFSPTDAGRSCRSFEKWNGVSVATTPGPSALSWPATPAVPWLAQIAIIFLIYLLLSMYIYVKYSKNHH